jgi:hypothetical protein
MTGVVIAAAGSVGDIHTISISDVTVDEIVTDPSDATASYSLENDGDIVVSSGADPGDWITPLDAFSDYECQMAIVSGSVTSGTTGSYLGLGTTRTWTRARTTIGATTFVGTLTIRRVSDAVVLDTATITLIGTVQ